MKRLLIALFIVLGFILAGCEVEEYHHHHHGDYYYHEGYPHEYYHHGYREYRLNDAVIQNGETVQTEADVQE